MKTGKTQMFQRIYFLLTAAEAALALIWLRTIVSDEKRSVFLGFSASRLALACVLLIFFLAALAGLAASFLPGKKGGLSRTGRIFDRPFPALLLITAFLSVAVLLYTGFIEPLKYRAYYERLLPPGAFFILLAAQTLIFSWLIYPADPSETGDADEPRNADRRLIQTALILLILEVVFFGLIQTTRLGLTSDPFDWQPNGMSIQYWQLAAALLFALVLFSLSLGLKNKIPEPIRGGFLFLLVWVVAALIWTAVPSETVLEHSYFMEITPPNNIPYPASDAAYFGLWSESILAGLGFKDTVISRQLFVVILAFVQSLAGKDMLLSIDYLTILLALIPACLFLLGRRMHSEGAGLFAAGIATLRELNTLYMGPLFGVSNSKMFLSDMPAFLFFLFFLLACTAWFRHSDSKMKSVLAGGTLGLAGLIRSQFLLFLPLVILLQYLRRIPAKKKAAGCLLFAMTTIAVLTPALTRSILLNGSLSLEDSGIHGFEIARRYSDNPDFTPERVEGESGAEFQSRMRQSIMDFVFSEPGYVLHFIANHFTKDLIDTWLVLPSGIPAGFTRMDITDPAYQQVEARFLNSPSLPNLVFAFLIALGIASIFRRSGFAGLLPLILCSAYMLTTAVGRYSGWRFILPADWMLYFYFAAGFFELLFLIRRKLPTGNPAPPETRKQPRPAPGRAVAALFLLMVLAGSLPVAVKILIPPQIQPASTGENRQQIQTWAEQYGEPYRSFLTRIDTEELDIRSGRVIYPRFFEANQGLTSANPWVVYAVRDFSRLGFVLLNEENTDVILPLETAPAPVPNGADCLVIGSQHEEGYFEGIAAVLPGVPDPAGKPTVIQP